MVFIIGFNQYLSWKVENGLQIVLTGLGQQQPQEADCNLSPLKGAHATSVIGLIESNPRG